MSISDIGDRWESDYERALALHDALEIRATGGRANDDEYSFLRNYFYSDAFYRSLLPDCAKVCRTLPQFWSFIKAKYGTYAERREYLRVEFTALLNYLENRDFIPLDQIVANGLLAFNTDAINAEWMKALERRETDPDGAITAARTLLETVCKHILDERGMKYDEGTNLPKLYRLTSEQLNLAPEQHDEEIFKQILGGCKSVVDGLGSLRNRLGDAHGKGRGRVKPSSRHAELAVNLAGSMAVFLVETYQFRYAKSKLLEDPVS